MSEASVFEPLKLPPDIAPLVAEQTRIARGGSGGAPRKATRTGRAADVAKRHDPIPSPPCVAPHDEASVATLAVGHLPPMHAELYCDIGMPRRFGSGDLHQLGMISGWAEPEEGHNWNNGKEALYVIATDAPVGRLRLDITGKPYITRTHPVQEMTIYGNGFRIGSLRVSARGETHLSIMLMPQWWFCEGRRATMHLVFHLPLSVRPCDVGEGEDGRELAFAFQSLCLRDSESWLGPRRAPPGG